MKFSLQRLPARTQLRFLVFDIGQFSCGSLFRLLFCGMSFPLFARNLLFVSPHSLLVVRPVRRGTLWYRDRISIGLIWPLGPMRPLQHHARLLHGNLDRSFVV